VIGVQLHSDEVYRDYPRMQQLVARLAENYHVLVFDAESIHGYDGNNIVKVAGMPMRKAFALAQGCSAIIAPDSAFVHLAGALDIPCVALYGPIDGGIRTMHYPNCIYVDVREKLGCMPCWRNDRIPCKLTNMRTSVCMADISVNDILSALTHILEKEKRREGIK
jgi:ADP-heptose:LPS heptosyltransferase